MIQLNGSIPSVSSFPLPSFVPGLSTSHFLPQLMPLLWVPLDWLPRPHCASHSPQPTPQLRDTWEKYPPLTLAPSTGCLAFSSWLIPLASGLSLSPPQASCRRTFRCLAVSLPRLHSSSPSLTCVTAPPEEPGFAFVGFLFWTCFCTSVCLYPLHTPQQTGSSPTQGQNPFFPSFLSTLGLQVAFLGEKNPKAVPSSL